MDITLSIAAFALSILGIIGCIVPALPGVALSYAGLLCAWFTSYSQMTSGAIWLWLAVTVAVSAADYFLPAWMTRRFGGSRSGAIGATAGVFAGFFLFPPVGIILGPFAGAVLGELLNDRSDVPKAFLVGFGSFLAFVVGTGVKLAASAGMLIVTLIYSKYTNYALSAGNYNILYGSLASIVALLFWFYFIAWVQCLGVLFNKVWKDTKR